jgi:hypothetical protein
MSKPDELIQFHGHSIAFGSDKHINNTGNNSSFQPLYDIVNSLLSFGYAVVYGAESFHNNGKDEKDRISHEILKSKGIDTKIKGNTTADNNKTVIEDSLLVLDADLAYDKNYAGEDILNYWFSQFSKIKEKIKEKQLKGIFGISSPDPYFNNNKHNVFIGFEHKMGKKISDNLAFLCWYKNLWLENLDFVQLLNVLYYHENVLYKNFYYERWTRDKIFKTISKVLDKVSGTSNESNDDFSILLFETIRNAYKLDKNYLLSNPQILQETLSKTLGKDNYYNFIGPSILKEIRKELLFDNDNGNYQPSLEFSKDPLSG